MIDPRCLQSQLPFWKCEDLVRSLSSKCIKCVICVWAFGLAAQLCNVNIHIHIWDVCFALPPHAHYPVDSQKLSTMETRNWAMCCISHVLLRGPFSRLITLWGLVDLKCVRRLCACLHYTFLISFTKYRCLVSQLVTVRQKTGVKSASTETTVFELHNSFSYALLFFPARI